jgi:hypothetical protein
MPTPLATAVAVPPVLPEEMDLPPTTAVVPPLTLDVVKEKKYEMTREQSDAKIQHQDQRDNWTKGGFKTYLPLLKQMEKLMFENRRLFWTRCFRHPPDSIMNEEELLHVQEVGPPLPPKALSLVLNTAWYMYMYNPTLLLPISNIVTPFLLHLLLKLALPR